MKKFLIKLSYTVFPIWLFVIGVLIYINVSIRPNIGGDIGSLGIYALGASYLDSLNRNALQTIYYNEVHHETELRNGFHQVLVVGDSFTVIQSNYGYVNYLAYQGLDVTKFVLYGMVSPCQVALDLLNLGYVDSTNVRSMVVEIVERGFIGRMKDLSVNEDSIRKVPYKKKEGGNMWKLSRVKDFVYYRFLGQNPITIFTLDRKYFEHEEPEKLYIYNDEFENFTIKDNQKELIRQNIQMLFSLAKEKGIDLYFVVAVDKYDLFQTHIVNNTYPSKRINEDIKELMGENNNIILTKDTLKSMVDKGIKDVYLYDDTHWSYKASKAVGELIYSRMKIGGLQ